MGRKGIKREQGGEGSKGEGERERGRKKGREGGEGGKERERERETMRYVKEWRWFGYLDLERVV